MRRIAFRSCFLFILLIGPFLGLCQTVPVIHITDLEKRIYNSSDTTYIVNFWATWCAPCVKELPDLDSITKSKLSPPVKVLLVSMDFAEDISGKVLPFLKKKPLRSEVLLLDEQNGNYFIPKISEKWTGAIPATLILNNKKNYKEFFEKKLSFEFLLNEINKINSK
jgi:thiol-disulfide isomerase/thioredoxin